MPPLSAQQLCSVAITLAIAMVVGAVASASWLARKPSPWAAAQLARLRAVAFGGAVAAALAHAAALWLQAAAMAEGPLSEAGAAALTLLASSHYGDAWKIGAAALLAIAVLAPGFARASRTGMADAAVALALAAYFYSRSIVSHAASDGDASWAVASEWLHLALVGLWVGGVLVAATITLPNRAIGAAADRIDRARYIQALSASATFALAGIVVTGLFSAWRNLGGIGNLGGNPYSAVLVAKLVLAALAAALGGANRWIVMPTVLGDGTDASLRRFTLVLRVEAAALVAVLAAALLGATATPMDFPSLG
jgi:putative copper resistance protein D